MSDTDRWQTTHESGSFCGGRRLYCRTPAIRSRGTQSSEFGTIAFPAISPGLDWNFIQRYTAHTDGDADNDDVGGADFLDWQQQLNGAPPGTISTSVPESGSFVLASLAVALHCLTIEQRGSVLLKVQMKRILALTG